MMNRVDAILARFPHFYRSGDEKSVLYRYLEVFAQEIDKAEEALLHVMYAHWIQTADNAPSKGRGKGDLDKLLSLYLERLGGTALIKQGNRRPDPEGSAEDDALYRHRAMGIINVLRNGAVTRQGILDIVAANLGVASDMPYQAEAKARIQIVEYLPELVVSGQDRRNQQSIKLFTPFSIHCQSDIETIPEFYLTFGDSLTANSLSLFNIKLVNADTHETVLYEGEVRAGDVLVFLAEGGVALHHKRYATIGQVTLSQGVNHFYLEAEYGKNQMNFIPYPFARFDQRSPLGSALFALDDTTPLEKDTSAQFDQQLAFDTIRFATTDPTRPLELPMARFDNESAIGKVVFGVAGRFEPIEPFVAHPFARFERDVPIHQAVFADDVPVARIDVSYQKRTCATFKVVVPWDLAGFSASIAINDATLAQLEKLEMPAAILHDLIAMKGEYATLETYYAALSRATKHWRTDERATWSEYLLQEATMTDKYVHYQVNPRTQLAAIVQRVKAAGVYAEVVFEKRFNEAQQLSDAFEFSAHQTVFSETQWLEDHFRVDKTGHLAEQQDVTDAFLLSAVFDHTRFDSLNGFG